MQLIIRSGLLGIKVIDVDDHDRQLAEYGTGEEARAFIAGYEKAVADREQRRGLFG